MSYFKWVQQIPLLVICEMLDVILSFTSCQNLTKGK